MNLLQPRRIVAAGLLAASVAILGFSSDTRSEESSLTPEIENELKAMVASFQGEPVFVPAGDPIDIKAALEGKLIYGIPVTSANPFTEGIYAAILKLAPVIGFEFKDWKNQGSLAEMQRGMQQAITDGAAVIDLTGGADPRLLGPQIAEARAEGILVMDSHSSGLTQGISDNVDATV